MLTLFAIPKPFDGQIALIQRNAIMSWTLLKPSPEIILFGDGQGVDQIAGELKTRHIRKIALNGYGTPLLDNLFETAQLEASHNLLCYVNADIILMSDFARMSQWASTRRGHFLIVGRRWDVDVNEPLDFNPGWEGNLKEHVSQYGQLHPTTGIDYFLFPRGAWGTIPAFAVGRTMWDNWLIYHARSRAIPVIDATQVVEAIHQNHDWSHIPKEEQEVWWEGPEARQNLMLGGGYEHAYTLEDASHIMTEGSEMNLSDPAKLVLQRSGQASVDHIAHLSRSRRFLIQMLDKISYLIPKNVKRWVLIRLLNQQSSAI